MNRNGMGGLALAALSGMLMLSACAGGKSAQAGVVTNAEETAAEETAAEETAAEETAAQESGAQETATQETAGRKEDPMTGNDVQMPLYRSLRASQGDFMYSPYSLKDAFAILYPAADGNSLGQLEGLFGFADGGAARLSGIDAEMVFRHGTGVRSVNRAYINSLGTEDGSLHPEVLGTDQVDIRPFGDGTAGEINSWIADQTEQKIRNLIPKSAITEDARAVLVNCLYFMMRWDAYEDEIDFRGSRIPSFSDGAPLTDVKEDGAIDILRLPYDKLEPSDEKEHSYAMYIMCDNDGSDEELVDSWMEDMTDERLREVLDFSGYGGLTDYTEADYNVPCFQMESTFSLKDPLIAAGLSDPFDASTKDFARFGPVYVDDVLQGTYIRCDEKGTEAAAATAIVMLEGAALDLEEPIIKHVVADSTFAFAIKDETAGEILFMGRVENPKYSR